MDKYFDDCEAPLKFHNFLKYIAFPLMVIGQFLTVLVTPEVLTTFSYWISLIICGVIMYGLYTWHPCGFFVLLGSHAVGVLIDLIALVSGKEGAFGELLWDGLFATLIWIYYLKRRPLFFPEMQKKHVQEKNVLFAIEKRKADKANDPTFCRICGEKLNTNRETCMKCGTAIPEDIKQQIDAFEVKKAAQPTRYRFCPQCGETLGSGYKFCSKCGEKIE